MLFSADLHVKELPLLNRYHLDRPATGVYSGLYGKAGGAGLFKSLRENVRQVLLSDVVRMDSGGNGGAFAGDAWRVMVLDPRATRVVSSVVGMYDIMEGHVTVVEDLYKVRESCAGITSRICINIICLHGTA